MEILQRTWRSTVRAMCGVKFKGRKSVEDLMLVLCLYETICQTSMANTVQ